LPPLVGLQKTGYYSGLLKMCLQKKNNNYCYLTFSTVQEPPSNYWLRRWTRPIRQRRRPTWQRRWPSKQRRWPTWQGRRPTKQRIGITRKGKRTTGFPKNIFTSISTNSTSARNCRDRDSALPGAAGVSAQRGHVPLG
jgi:hypothetical protein